MNTKKYILITILFVFSFISFQSVSACSLQDLKGCDRQGLISLIKDLIKTRQSNIKDIAKLTKDGFSNLYGDWYYKFQNFSPNPVYCGYENVLLTNITTGEKFYVFDKKEPYSNMECLGRYFKLDSDKNILYFQRSYEMCTSSFYSYDMETRKLLEMENISNEAESYEELEEIGRNHCFNSFFDNFTTLSLDPVNYPDEEKQ